MIDDHAQSRARELCRAIWADKDGSAIQTVFRHEFRKDIARRSGLPATTIKKIMDGNAKATKAQKAALCFAFLDTDMRLHAAEWTA